jgi:hypothetical protein
VGSGCFVGLPEGRSLRRPFWPGRGLGPEGLWSRVRPLLGRSRGACFAGLLAGHPKVAALLSPRFVRARRSWRSVGRARGSASEGAFPEGLAVSPRRHASALDLCRPMRGLARLPPTRGPVAFGLRRGSGSRGAVFLGLSLPKEALSAGPGSVGPFPIDRTGVLCPEGRVPPGPRGLLALPEGRVETRRYRLPRPLRGRFRGLRRLLPSPRGGLLCRRPSLWLWGPEGSLRFWLAVRGSGQCRHRSPSPATLVPVDPKGSASRSRRLFQAEARLCSPPAPRCRSSPHCRSGVEVRARAGRVVAWPAPERRNHWAETRGRFGFVARRPFRRSPWPPLSRGSRSCSGRLG